MEMNNFKIRLADKIIEISAIHKYIADYCKEYISTGISDFSVQVTQSDIDFEREKSKQEDIKENIPIRHFSDDYLETLAVYRKIADEMLEYNTILFHGSVVSVDNIGYLFTAKSGTGKSTHTSLWREFFKERAVMVNDDKPLLRVTENGVTAYGTPWNGKHRLSTNIGVPLNAICVLERSDENHIEKVTAESVYNMLVQQVYRPQNPQKLLRTLQLIDAMADNVNFYRLGCNTDISAAETAYNGMKG